MSDAEKALRDRLRRRMVERMSVWVDRPDEFDLLYFSHANRAPFGTYTKQRLFDGRFWSMQYRWVQTRGRYELVRTSVRQHAKRKDAKDRAWGLHAARSVR